MNRSYIINWTFTLFYKGYQLLKTIWVSDAIKEKFYRIFTADAKRLQ